MIELPGFSITEKVYEDAYILVAFALSEKAAQRKLLKIVKSGKRVMVENAKLIHEFNFLSTLDMEGLFKPTSYLSFKEMMVLEYEPIDAVTLRDYWADATAPAAYVPILKNIVKRLQELHEREILHFNIRPDTLLIQRHTYQIYLTGFGYAVHQKHREEQGQGSLEGNPIYMSPEQTGRMNTPVDARADIYSLGMTLYEVFSKKLPFTAKGALDWAHAHMAQEPVPIQHVNPTLPPMISEMIMRMLAKDPEERYPSMKAILEELEESLTVENHGDGLLPKTKNDTKGITPDRSPTPEQTSERKASLTSQGRSMSPAQRTPLAISDHIVSYPQVLDLAALVQASQIFTEEAHGGKIAERMMHLVIKHAGAQRGLLLLLYHNQWYVNIEAELGADQLLSSLQHIPLEAYADIRRELVLGALQSKEILQRMGGRENSRRTEDLGRRTRSGSVLCLPLMVEDQMQGLLYLENQLIQQHFAPERFHVLKNIASQALFALKTKLAAESFELEQKVIESKAELKGHIMELQHSLTKREKEVLHLLAKGFSNKEIAAELTITSETVKTHLKKIFEKLRVDRRIKAVAVAKTIGILDDEDRL